VQDISHYLERMLGSADFPGESDFGKLLASHEGNSSVYTECEFTTYYFNVDSCFLRPALQHFASFFKKSLCSESALERAVCSSFSCVLWHSSVRPTDAESLRQSSVRPSFDEA
jgi:secreted Zn-dependent insulinase-like peptidase